MYLTFDEYQSLGGLLDEATFSFLEKKARYKLNYYTQDRIKDITPVPEEVKDTIFQFIENLENIPEEAANLSSYSNGIESMNFKDDVDLYNSLYRIAVENLPVELITAAVN